MHVRFRWWFASYLLGVRAISKLTGLKPDMEKVDRMIRRAMIIEHR